MSFPKNKSLSKPSIAKDVCEYKGFGYIPPRVPSHRVPGTDQWQFRDKDLSVPYDGELSQALLALMEPFVPHSQRYSSLRLVYEKQDQEKPYYHQNVSPSKNISYFD